MEILTHVPLHKLPVQVLHVRVVGRAQVFFYRNGGGRRHVFRISIRAGQILRRYNSSDTQVMKVAISLSDKIFREAEAAAKTRGISRSQLYATALAAFLQQHRPSGVTAKLNAIYGKKPATM